MRNYLLTFQNGRNIETESPVGIISIWLEFDVQKLSSRINNLGRYFSTIWSKKIRQTSGVTIIELKFVFTNKISALY